jgi:hypothetical protein
MEISLEEMARYLSGLQTSVFFRLLETPDPDRAAEEIGTLMRFIEKGIAVEC